MHCHCHFGNVKSTYQVQTPQPRLRYVMLYTEQEDTAVIWANHKPQFYSTTILSVEIDNIRMHPNTSAGFN